MSDLDLPVPVREILAVGRPDEEDWPDYPARFGLTAGHVPALVRVMRDWRRSLGLLDAAVAAAGDGADVRDEDLPPEGFAHIHAWRALGQLRAAGAVEPMLQTLDEMTADPDEDWGLAEIPLVLERVGEPAVETIAAFLLAPGHNEWAKSGAGDALAKIGRAHPAARDRCVAALTGALARHAVQTHQLNAGLIGSLIDLKAAEAAPVIREAYAQQDVDGTICGTWAQVRDDLRLAPQPGDPPPVSMAEYSEKYTPEMAKLTDAIVALAAARGAGGATGGGFGKGASVDRSRRRDERKRERKAKRKNRKRR